MKRILVVEDDRARCLELANMLMEFGFEVAVADTSAGALDTLVDADPLPDLLLVDITMPDGDGLRLVEIVRKHRLFCKMKMVKMAGDRAFTSDPKSFCEIEKPMPEFVQEFVSCH